METNLKYNFKIDIKKKILTLPISETEFNLIETDKYFLQVDNVFY